MSTHVDSLRGTEPVVRSSVHAFPVTMRRVIESEWIKFRTLRSTWALLGASIIGMLAIGVLVAYNTRSLAGIQPEDRGPSATLQGHILARLLIGALGILLVTGEYGTGTIRASFAAVPRRLPVLWAKTAVFAAVTLVALTASSVVTFIVSQAVLARYRPGFSLGDGEVLRYVLATGGYLTLVGILGAALGWVIRSTPGALVTYIGLMLVLPAIFRNALGSTGSDIAQFLPSEAGNSFINSVPDTPSLSPWAGAAVLVVWVAAALGTAAVCLLRRDA